MCNTSYAWDTATLFLQTCGTNTTYSRKNSINTALSQTGTNTQVIVISTVPLSAIFTLAFVQF